MKVLFFVALLFVALASKIHPEVEQKITKSGSANVFIEFAERLNFEKLAQEKGNFDDMEEDARGFLVMNSLMEVAKRSQQNVIEYLKAANIPFEAFWIDNKIAIFNVKSFALQVLEKFAEVSEIAPIVETQLDEPAGVPVNSTADIEIGISHVKAPQVWAKGVKGKGVVLGNSDTGAFLHPDMKNTYRGVESGNDYNWFDAIASRAAPYDDHSHGTHCIGSKVGTSANTKVGVAPEAQWIACKWLNAAGGGNAAGALKCLQFFLAPTKTNGQDPDPTKRPHITSHSYRCPCNLQNAVKALIAAGVEVVVAAGNSGPRCNTVTEPAFFPEAFAVGALNRGADTITSFSSKGPHQNLVKPDVSAPGAAVRSCSNRGGYTAMSGTSMACPHVAGTYG